MKRLLPFIFLITSIFPSAYSQTYGNEWINFSQTYFKFKIINDGLYRISYNTLLSSGVPLSNISGSNLQIFNKAREIPIYVTTDGTFGNGDYIEFYAIHNDGVLDSALYGDKAWQANDHLSLFSDSASYFLTWNNQSNNNHIVSVNNNIINPPAKENYCWYTSKLVFGQSHLTLSRGEVALAGQTFYDSDFSNTEGYSDIYFNKSTVNYAVSTPSAYVSAPSGNLKSWLVRWGPDSHSMDISLNGNPIYSGSHTGFLVEHLDIPVPSSIFTSPVSNLTYSAAASVAASDLNSVAWIELKYARIFNFDNASQLFFNLNASVNNQYIEINNFSENGTTPVLYDFTNKLRLEAVVQNDTEKFLLPPSSTERELFLLAYDTISVIRKMDAMQEVHFTDFSNVANQGDFIIISNPFFFKDSTGNNYVDEYKNYKNSNGYHAIVVNIFELYDQFAYGIDLHPASIRKFSDFILDKWPPAERHIFLIGKGIEYWYTWNSLYRPLCYVPTFGFPGSDNLLTAKAGSCVPRIPIGRLPCLTAEETGIYLDKAILFTAAQKDHFQTIANKGWMKNALHLGGGANDQDQVVFKSYLNKYASILKDTLYGGNIYTFLKTSTDPIQYIVSAFLDSIINSGVSLITFYGHSSYNSFDFNLDRPENYNNYGKYPVVLTNGCLIGNLFSNTHGLSDQFVFAKDRGAIAFLAPSQFSVSTSLDLYSTNFYRNLSINHYNQSLGTIVANTMKDVITQSAQPIDKTMAEQMLFNGDPSLKINTFPKPDYDLEPQKISYDPPSVTSGLDSFFLQVVLYNIGEAVNDSFYVDLKRTLPNGSEEFLYHKKIKAPYFIDTIRLSVKTEPKFAFGLNKFNIKIDAGDSVSASGEIDEISELNNEINTNLLITSDDIVPVFPYDYSIVNEQGITLKASTVNAFAGEKQYVFQIDTTKNFNSGLFQQKKILQKGGILKWQPSIALKDGAVYYWRTSLDTLYENEFTWHDASFIYLPGSPTGWNQSHYFQFQSTIQANGNIQLPATRNFQFVDDIKTVGVLDGITSWIGGPLALDDPGYYINGVEMSRLWDCMNNGATMLLEVIDSATGLPWSNLPGGKYGSIQCKPTPRFNFFYSTSAAENSEVGVFLDTIPDGDYILMMSINDANIRNWDSTMKGYFNQLGLTQLNTINAAVPYVAFLKKNDASFPVYEVIGDTFNSIIDTNFAFSGNWDHGFVESPLIGPAASWSSLHWKAHSIEAGSDSISLQLIGVNNLGVETVLSNQVTANDSSITGIDVGAYPYLRLKLNSSDTTDRTPVQLDYWRVNYQPVPEAALNPAAFISLRDTVNQFLPLKFSVALENITPWKMDSLLVKYEVTDVTNAVHNYSQRYQPLNGNDTIHLSYDFTISSDVYVGGLNYIYLEANPDNDQPEQSHFNNLGIIHFQVSTDNVNPLLDVTFDGIHIMDGDLVSAKPDIEMMLKDESKSLALDDTTLFDIYLIYPDGSKHVVNFDNLTAFFYPADSGNLAKENSAHVTLKKSFTIDGTYQLLVQGYDRSGNPSGDNHYKISFEVINKPMISNVLNYPNPFATSTRFVFTLTGSEIPQFMKIQVMTISGRIIKELFMNQLGKIHIGNNITDYTWDGTDQFGDKLANGLYFYRVSAVLNGMDMDHYGSGADTYFKNGIGKMYLMR